MNHKFLSLALTLMFATISVADDDAPAKKKRKRDAAGRNNVATNVLKQLKDVELTDEQTAKIKEIAKKSMAEMQAVRKEAGITAEVMKKRAAAQKELKESGMKQSELFAAVNKKAGLTESQVAAIKKTNESRSALLKNAVALLTDEQKAKLPQRMLRTGNRKRQANDAGEKKRKGKKAKEATDA